MWYDLIIYIVVGIILIGLAIDAWPLTLIVLAIYFFYKYKKKEASEELNARINVLQSDVKKIGDEINKLDIRKASIVQTVNDIQLELLPLKECLFDMQRFQAFFIAFTLENQEFALPKLIEAVTYQIKTKEGQIAELESEDRSNASKKSNLKSSLEAKMQTIKSLQEQQAANEKRK